LGLALRSIFCVYFVSAKPVAAGILAANYRHSLPSTKSLLHSPCAFTVMLQEMVG